MIFVCGISASGKSHVVSLFTAADPSFIHVKGSKILEECGQPIRNLKYDEARENQTVLRRELLRRHLTSHRHILDGHMTIATDTGFFPIPDWFFDSIRIDRIICLLDDPRNIAKRLLEKGISSSMPAIDAHQRFEQGVAIARATSLECPYSELAARDLDGFARALSS
jgi:adenylate kinase